MQKENEERISEMQKENDDLKEMQGNNDAKDEIELLTASRINLIEELSLMRIENEKLALKEAEPQIDYEKSGLNSPV